MAGVAKGVGKFAEAAGYETAAEGARVAGRRRRVASEFEAEQMEQAAGQAIAASQRTAMEETRRGDLAASRALALAAASGAGASDATAMRIIAGLKGEGSYRSAVALYRGEEEARKLRTGSRAKSYEGLIAEEGGLYQGAMYEAKATASTIEGFGSLFESYGKK